MKDKNIIEPLRETSEFITAYIAAALWSTMDENENSLDAKYTINDLSDETFDKIVDDCIKFEVDYEYTIKNAKHEDNDRYSNIELAGHDFWFTRNDFGVGFYDGSWSEPEASILDEAAQKFGSFTLYVGDDGKIYHT